MNKEQQAMSTDNPPTAALCNHLLPCVLVAQHGAASVDRHQTVEALNSDFVTLSEWCQPNGLKNVLSRNDPKAIIPAFATIY